VRSSAARVAGDRWIFCSGTPLLQSFFGLRNALLDRRKLAGFKIRKLLLR